MLLIPELRKIFVSLRSAFSIEQFPDELVLRSEALSQKQTNNNPQIYGMAVLNVIRKKWCSHLIFILHSSIVTCGSHSRSYFSLWNALWTIMVQKKIFQYLHFYVKSFGNFFCNLWKNIIFHYIKTQGICSMILS